MLESKKLILTPRELQIVHLLAEGKNNRQIAEELYISLRTVESHLTHIYANNGINSHKDVLRLYWSALLEKEKKPQNKSIDDGVMLELVLIRDDVNRLSTRLEFLVSKIIEANS